MSYETSTGSALAAQLWPERSARVVRFVVLALLGSAFLTLAAKIQVPFWPVPMTMTTFAVFVLGATYGSRLAGAAVIAYILEGVAGLPVFAGPVAGPAYLLGPTGGYIIGYAVAAYLIGLAADRGLGRSIVGLAVTMFLADVVLFTLGALWLAASVIGFDVAVLEKGVFPFVLADLLKIGLAAVAVPAVFALLPKKRA
ncbi:biotin transporter BioY [Prosthecomicrobium pneumaticum]|uniref:Biotin transporter n=1 Tax=Prosthecomicrobium pneumaticum TaxID=81895 RepID=A0A7W9CVK0_9HYPH|nr:biotin transporter BioY [Prosthecomicrobium pneumaticum]MBB5752388.1 biotin transport system substrate-specific component [Prosthecomicrobium pneumaticum]